MTPEALAHPWWAYLLLGIVGGVYGGTLGLGSGTVFIPVLVLFFSLPQKSAQGVSLAVMVPMALVAAVRYKMNPHIPVDMRVVALMAAGAVAGALVGAEIAHRLPSGILRKIFAICIIIAGVRLLWGGAKPAQPSPAGPAVQTKVQETIEETHREGH